MKLETHDTYEKDDKITTNFEPANNENAINNAYLDEKFLKIDGHLLFSVKDYNEFKTHYNKQSVEEILIQKAVKTAI